MRVLSTFVGVALLSMAIAAPASAAEADPVRLDVGLVAGADPAPVLAALGDAVVDSHPVLGLDAVAVDVAADRAEASLTTLAALGAVRYAERGSVVGADGELVSTNYDVLQIPGAWTWTTGRADVTVAVVDTGVSPTADLGADRLAPGYDVVGGDTDTTDDDGHGTLAAEIIGAERGNGIGSAGVCDGCMIMPVRVMAGRQGTTADVAAGIVWAADHGAQVVSVSLSTATPSDLLQDAVAHAAGKGSLVVASAGNDLSSTAKRYPAAYEPALAVNLVGATEKNTAASQWVDVGAYPGWGLNKNGQLVYLSGTSGATAMTAGIAALAFSMQPGATAAEVRAAIVRDADPRNSTPAYQTPIVNAAHLVYDFGGTDTVAPVITETNLTENEPIPAAGLPAVTSATDDHAVQRIDYIVDGRVAATARRSGGQVTLKPPAGYNGPMPVTIAAYDYAGNVVKTTVTLRADTVAPTVTLVSPAANAYVHGTWIDVTLAIPDTDIDYVYSVYEVGAISYLTKVPGTNLWKGKVPIDPQAQLYLATYDKAGNSTFLIRTMQVDNSPPTGGSISPASGAKVRGTFVSTLTGVTDASGVAKAELWANGRYVGADTSAPYSLSVKTGAYNGTVSLTWKVTDRWGQSRTLAARKVTADNRGPSLSIAKAPKSTAKVSGTVKVYVKATDTSGVARVELIVNGKVVARDMTAGYVLAVNTKKQKKTMKVQVRAYDKLGNVSYTTTRTWHR